MTRSGSGAVVGLGHRSDRSASHRCDRRRGPRRVDPDRSPACVRSATADPRPALTCHQRPHRDAAQAMAHRDDRTSCLPSKAGQSRHAAFDRPAQAMPAAATSHSAKWPARSSRTTCAQPPRSTAPRPRRVSPHGLRHYPARRRAGLERPRATHHRRPATGQDVCWRRSAASLAPVPQPLESQQLQDLLHHDGPPD